MPVKQSIIEILTDLPHAREVQDYLIDMAIASTGKKKPSADYMSDLNRKSGIFVDAYDLEKVLNDICEIYLTKGYRKPWELENDLIRLYQPELPEAAIQTADLYAAEELTPDHLTGYHHKTQVPLVMGLAALYGKTTGEPVSVLEIDYSNMRGTNEHFARLIGAAENKPPQNAMHDAMMLTDQMSFVVARTIIEKLEEGLPAGSKPTLIPLRTGGDEIRVVMAGFPAIEASRLLPGIHAGIEDVTASAGLHDHVHSKRPLDEWSNGFGACAAVFELKAEGHNAYSRAISDADHAIQKVKAEIGKQRRNNPLFDSRKPPGSNDPALYHDQKLAAAHFTDVMSAIAVLRHKHACINVEENTVPTLELLAAALTPDHFLTVPEIREQFHLHLKEDLKNKGIPLTKAQENLLQIKVMRFPAQDYASGTLLSRDMPAMAGAALQVTDDINRRAGRNDAVWTVGVSFHNLAGLNETLGHEVSNVILRHQALNILEESFFKAGIARENMVLAHMGGGEFRMIIQPLITCVDGTKKTIDAHTMDKICRDIRHRTLDLNRTEIKDFAENNGLKIDTSGLPQYFSDIKNPRDGVQPGENGITATITAQPYRVNSDVNTQEFRRGGALVSFIGENMEEAVRLRRSEAKEALVASPANGQKDQMKFI